MLTSTGLGVQLDTAGLNALGRPEQILHSVKTVNESSAYAMTLIRTLRCPEMSL